MIGIHDSMPFGDYLALDAVNVSALKQVADCPAKVGTVKEQSAAMMLGSLTHCAILEPEELERRYAATDLERSGTKAWQAAEDEADGRELIKRAEWNAALRMRDAVWAHPTARALLTGAVTERTLVWVDDETGATCKARLDLYGTKGPADVKAMSDASPRTFSSSCERLGYYLQAAHYLCGCYELGLQAPDLLPFIVVEREPPHVVEVYDLDDDSVMLGIENRGKLLKRYLQCKVSGVWPAYTPTGRTKIRLPAYSFTKEV